MHRHVVSNQKLHQVHLKLHDIADSHLRHPDVMACTPPQSICANTPIPAVNSANDSTSHVHLTAGPQLLEDLLASLADNRSCEVRPRVLHRQLPQVHSRIA